MKAWKLEKEIQRKPYYRPQTSLYQAMRQCYRKAGFGTEGKAHAKVQDILYEGGPHLYVYSCLQCGKFHLTKNQEAEGKTF